MNTKKICRLEFLKEVQMKIFTLDAPLSELFFRTENQKHSRTHGFLLYGNKGLFFSTSELLLSNLKVRLQIIKARPIFYIISNNPNIGRGIVECSLNNRRIALKDDYH